MVWGKGNTGIGGGGQAVEIQAYWCGFNGINIGYDLPYMVHNGSSFKRFVLQTIMKNNSIVRRLYTVPF